MGIKWGSVSKISIGRPKLWNLYIHKLVCYSCLTFSYSTHRQRQTTSRTNLQVLTWELSIFIYSMRATTSLSGIPGESCSHYICSTFELSHWHYIDLAPKKPPHKRRRLESTHSHSDSPHLDVTVQDNIYPDNNVSSMTCTACHRSLNLNLSPTTISGSTVASQGVNQFIICAR